MLKTLFLVGLGGGVGSIIRYMAGLYVHRYFPSTFPWGTLAVNVLGCFLIGLFMGLSERSTSLDPNWRLLLVVGFCGGFTTFSALSMESINLLQNHQAMTAFLYIGLSVVVGLSATLTGFLLMR